MNDFINWINKTRKSSGDLYYHMLRDFTLWLSPKDLNNFSPPDAEEYISSRRNPNTANASLAAIKAYSKYKVSKASSDGEFFRESRRYHALSNIKYRKVPLKIERKALTPEEISTLLKWSLNKPELFPGLVCIFYFGWRPIEGIRNLEQVSWRRRYVILTTAKSGNQRVVPFDKKVKPALADWISIAKILRNYGTASRWITRHLYTAPVRATAKTGRRTFETEMRRSKIEQWKIDYLLGHKTKISDRYADWTELLEDLREVMEEKHYLIPLLP